MDLNSSNDMNEDFQFRPITEGLGFQKKRGLLANKATLNSQNNSQMSSQINSPLSSPLPRSENKTNVRPTSVSSPVPSPTPAPAPHPVSTPSPAMEKVLSSMARKRNLDFVTTRPQPEKPYPEKTKQVQILKRPAVYAVWSLPAAFFDMMVVAALSLTAIIILVGVTHLDLLASINNSDKTVLISLATLVAGVSFIYPVVGRVFAGMTLGEWVFELQTGTPEAQKKTFYGIRVLFRGLLVMATGVVVLPFLSLIFRTDLAGKLSGVRLVKRPQ